jgi:hypothetical protein
MPKPKKLLLHRGKQQPRHFWKNAGQPSTRRLQIQDLGHKKFPITKSELLRQYNRCQSNGHKVEVTICRPSICLVGYRPSWVEHPEELDPEPRLTPEDIKRLEFNEQKRRERRYNTPKIERVRRGLHCGTRG